MHGWKNAFDAGEWGLGRMVNSLELGCDCLGTIHYLDATFATERGEPYVVRNAICIHEEDYGILWKHQDMHSGRTEVRRSRRLVVSSIATVGNYEYGFYWYFYLDGTIQLEVKLTGVMQTQALAPGHRSRYASPIAPDLAAPVHQHLFCARLDFEVDGTVNEVHEVEAHPIPPGADNPWANAFVPVTRRLDSELAARRTVDPATSRCWKFVNPDVHNRLGEPGLLQARPRSVAGHARRRRIQRGPAGRLRPLQPVGHPLRPRGAPRGGRLPQPARGRRRPAQDGRPPTGHWWAPTSWPGTPSA